MGTSDEDLYVPDIREIAGSVTMKTDGPISPVLFGLLHGNNRMVFAAEWTYIHG